jgi:hypothetical protein
MTRTLVEVLNIKRSQEGGNWQPDLSSRHLLRNLSVHILLRQSVCCTMKMMNCQPPHEGPVSRPRVSECDRRICHIPFILDRIA